MIKEGDRNTSYFHALANHRDRKKRIDCLRGHAGLVHDHDKMVRMAVDFYKMLFKEKGRGPLLFGWWFLGPCEYDKGVR
jgi:hypothetical protein